MNNHSAKQITTTEFSFSGESDFEIINHSDSELSDNYDGFAESNNHSLSSRSSNESSELSSIVNNTNPDRIMLSLSQEQIFVVSKQCTSREPEERNPTHLSNFSNPFSLIPIKIPDESLSVRKPHLPEIVLTSFDSNSQDDKVSRFPENKSTPIEMCELSPQLRSASEVKTIFGSSSSISTKGASSQDVLNLEKCATTTTKPLNLSKALPYQMAINISRRPSASIASSCRGLDRIAAQDNKEAVPSELKCRICDHIYKDPRTLNCLHSFCLQCLINETFGSDAAIPFWSGTEGNSFEWKGNANIYTTPRDSDPLTPTRSESRSSTSSKKADKNAKSAKKGFKTPVTCPSAEKLKILICSLCQYCTEMPIGGIYQLPQNSVLVRKIENFLLSVGNSVISSFWCNLCSEEIPATYLCITCAINLCGFCKEAHERQRTTAHHNINNLLELRKLKETSKHLPDGPKFTLKCSLHPGFELKSFCITCKQIVCSDCTVLLHIGHKYDSAHKIFKTYQKIIKDSVEKTKPLSEYANHSISKLAGISKKINEKCDQVQHEVEMHIASYFEALEVHRNTLLQQVARARETKMQMILEQQLDLEKRSSQAKAVVEFSEQLTNLGSEAEILSFVNILLKRFEFCAQYKPPIDPKISDTLHFLSEVRAPSTKAQNNIPLYGIITTQTVEPTFCTLETKGYDQLRVHRKAELIILSRDGDGVPLCHGGLTINAILKYKDAAARAVTLQIGDRRDGSYVISFTPDTIGILVLSVMINSKHIKGSPFTLGAKSLRPHTGIYHCCTFCSSKGSKTVLCACEGVMVGFKGCGHGHSGHPGRRHWSCCASVLENSECTTANKF